MINQLITIVSETIFLLLVSGVLLFIAGLIQMAVYARRLNVSVTEFAWMITYDRDRTLDRIRRKY